VDRSGRAVFLLFSGPPTGPARVLHDATDRRFATSKKGPSPAFVVGSFELAIARSLPDATSRNVTANAHNYGSKHSVSTHTARPNKKSSSSSPQRHSLFDLNREKAQSTSATRTIRKQGLFYCIINHLLGDSIQVRSPLCTGPFVPAEETLEHRTAANTFFFFFFFFFSSHSPRRNRNRQPSPRTVHPTDWTHHFRL
jgi:hypothetical protein